MKQTIISGQGELHLELALKRISNRFKVELLKEQISTLKEFEKITGVPVLLNTSFNVAGEPLVETVNDAVDTFKKTNIDVLWFPEKEIILTK